MVCLSESRRGLNFRDVIYARRYSVQFQSWLVPSRLSVARLRDSYSWGRGGMKGLPIILCFELYYRSGLLTWPFISIAKPWTQSKISECSVRPFDESSVIYLHCIDLSTEKFTPVTSFACMEICCVLGHFSFPRDLAVRRLCCFLWSKELHSQKFRTKVGGVYFCYAPAHMSACQ